MPRQRLAELDQTMRRQRKSCPAETWMTQEEHSTVIERMLFGVPAWVHLDRVSMRARRRFRDLGPHRCPDQTESFDHGVDFLSLQKDCGLIDRESNGVRAGLVDHFDAQWARDV